MSEFIVISTPEQRLIVLLTETIGLKANLVQQGGAVAVPLSGDRTALIMADSISVGQWHVVAGKEGADWFRGIAEDTWSLLVILQGLGLTYPLANSFSRNVWHNRWAKANRLLQYAADDDEMLDDVQWEDIAEAHGEKPPSLETITIINHIVWEETRVYE